MYLLKFCTSSSHFSFFLFLFPSGEKSGTVVPSTSDDNAAIYDPHDYDEVPIDEGAVLLPRPPAESAVPDPVPESILEKEDDGVYSEVSTLVQASLYNVIIHVAYMIVWQGQVCMFVYHTCVIQCCFS